MKKYVIVLLLVFLCSMACPLSAFAADPSSGVWQSPSTTNLFFNAGSSTVTDTTWYGTSHLTNFSDTRVSLVSRSVLLASGASYSSYIKFSGITYISYVVDTSTYSTFSLGGSIGCYLVSYNIDSAGAKKSPSSLEVFLDGTSLGSLEPTDGYFYLSFLDGLQDLTGSSLEFRFTFDTYASSSLTSASSSVVSGTADVYLYQTINLTFNSSPSFDSAGIIEAIESQTASLSSILSAQTTTLLNALTNLNSALSSLLDTISYDVYSIYTLFVSYSADWLDRWTELKKGYYTSGSSVLFDSSLGQGSWFEYVASGSLASSMFLDKFFTNNVIRYNGSAYAYYIAYDYVAGDSRQSLGTSILNGMRSIFALALTDGVVNADGTINEQIDLWRAISSSSWFAFMSEKAYQQYTELVSIYDEQVKEATALGTLSTVIQFVDEAGDQTSSWYSNILYDLGMLKRVNADEDDLAYKEDQKDNQNAIMDSFGSASSTSISVSDINGLSNIFSYVTDLFTGGASISDIGSASSGAVSSFSDFWSSDVYDELNGSSASISTVDDDGDDGFTHFYEEQQYQVWQILGGSS